MGMPNLGQMRSEIVRMEGQKSGVEAQRGKIAEALSELRSKKSQIDAGMAEIRSKLGMEMPPHVKKQLTDRLAMMSNAKKSISMQISTLSERLAQAGEAMRGLRSGIKSRKMALERLAGQVARLPMNNREIGRKKG
jgi:chromosome segregation ATPase